VALTETTRSQLLAAEPPAWDIATRRTIIREMLVHEDKLTNERIQSLYTLQGFLFAAFGLLVKDAKFPLAVPIQILSCMIAAVGFTAARFYYQELQFNTAAITSLLDEWNELRKLFPDTSYPAIIGHVANVKPGGPSWLTRRTIPFLIMAVWVIAAGVALWQ